MHILKKDSWLNFIDYGVEYSLYALIFILPLSKAGIEIFFAISFFLFLVKKILKPDFAFLKSSPFLFLFLFILFCCLSFINSGVYLEKSIKALVFKWLEYIIIFLMIVDTLSKPQYARKALIIFLASSAIVGIDGISQFFLGMELTKGRELVMITQQPRFYGMTASFNHYNDLGNYLVPAVLLAMTLLFAAEAKKIYRYVLTSTVMLLVLCLFFSYSRSAWLGFLVGLIVMLFLTRWLGVFCLSISIFVILIFLLPNVKERIFYTFQEYGTSERFFVWKIGWKMITESPFLGKGLGTFMDYCSKYSSGEAVQYAHNNYLQIWAESGIFALLSFLSFVGHILYKGIKVYRRNTDFILLSLIVALSGFLVGCFFDTQLYSLQLATLFWYLSGILVAKTEGESKRYNLA